jgi:hypothetical protein
MASERQIAANLRNSSLSSGPKTESGRARSRLNATKHGLAGELVEVESGFSDDFNDRRAKWDAVHRPVGDGADFALDRAVAASFRIERCQRALDDLTASASQRAELVWNEDRAVEAATIAGRLSRDPVLASRQLQTTLAGVELLIEFWIGLAAALQPGTDWSESERSRALDLFGIAADLRSGRTLIDTPEGTDPVAHHRGMAMTEVDRLEKLRDRAMVAIDETEQLQMMAGDVAMLSKPAQLVLRYEREAWRQYREAMKEVKASAQDPEPFPKPIVARPAQVVNPAPAKAESARSFEAERRALLAEASTFLSNEDRQKASMILDAEPDWLGDLEKRVGSAAPNARPSHRTAEVAGFSVGRVDQAMGGTRAPERSQFGGNRVDQILGRISG